MAKLLCQAGPTEGTVYDLVPGEVTVGRGVENTIQIPSETVSRTHCCLLCRDEAWTLRDEGSRNGTLVNGAPVEEVVLKPGDEIRVGEATMIFTGEQVDTIEAESLSDASSPDLQVSDVLDSDTFTQRVRQHAAEAATRGDVEGHRLVTLLEFSSRSHSARNMSDLFGALTAAIENDLEPHRVVPILVDEKQGLVRPWVKSASAFDKALSNIPLSQTIVNYVRDKRVAVLSEETKQDSRFRKALSIHKQKITSAMCAPMRIGDELLGLIYVDRLGEAEHFTAADLELLNAMACQAAVAIANVRSVERVGRERQVREKQLRGQYDIVGQSGAIQQVFRFIAKAAPAQAGVIILGESGTGKELVARAIHVNSQRRHQPFEAVNCAALTPSLLESEIFGHVRGAFTGADADRPGLFELADGGTLFLDEIGEMPDGSQSKLLRVLEQGELRRVGDVRDRKVNVRVIAATNKRLEEEMRAGRFREDLYFRLNVLKVQLPPLRDRREDIPLLAENFLHAFVKSCGRTPLTFDPGVLDLFGQVAWRGNVRELRNVIERMVVMAEGDVLRLDDVPYELRHVGDHPAAAAAVPAGEPGPLREVERAHIARTLDHTGGNKKEAARILEIDRSTLYAKLKAYGLNG